MGLRHQTSLLRISQAQGKTLRWRRLTVAGVGDTVDENLKNVATGVEIIGRGAVAGSNVVGTGDLVEGRRVGGGEHVVAGRDRDRKHDIGTGWQ